MKGGEGQAKSLLVPKRHLGLEHQFCRGCEILYSICNTEDTGPYWWGAYIEQEPENEVA